MICETCLEMEALPSHDQCAVCESMIVAGLETVEPKDRVEERFRR